MERLGRLLSGGHGIRTFALTVFMAGMLSIWLVGCGDNTTPPSNSPVADNPTAVQPTAVLKAGGQQVGIILNEWSILPANLTIPPGSVTFVVTNKGQASHNLTISGPNGVLGQTPDFTASQGPKNIALTLQPGTYQMVCSIPGHAEKGMTSVLTVK